MKGRTGRVTPRAKSETAKASARTEWLQLGASVNYIEPPIWRRLQIPGSLTLGGLHHVLQTAFGWTDSHLHRFSRGRTELGDALWARQAFGRKGAELLYEYDFGDSWEVHLVLEDVLGSVEGAGLACLDGERAGPLDDCGGVPGYENLLDALADPQHPDHDDFVEWSGGNYGPEQFDREAINRALAELRRLR